MPHNNANALTPRPEVLTRPKLEGGRRFVMQTDYTAAGDQPTAIADCPPASGTANAIRCFWAPPAPARPSPWPR